MTDKSAFTDDEWKTIEEAPLLISLAIVTYIPSISLWLPSVMR